MILILRALASKPNTRHSSINCAHIKKYVLAKPYLDKTAAANTSILGILVEVDQKSKKQTSNISNFTVLNFEHIRTSHFGPKENFELPKHH